MSTKKPLAYLAGPYRGGPDNDNIPVNVAEAMRWWNALTDAGLVVFCPHLNMFLDMSKERSAEFWLEWDMEWLRKCDALFRIPGKSSGSEAEIELCKELGIPVYHSLDLLLEELSEL